MTSADYKLPVKINDYIQRHFRGEFLFKINSVRKTGNHTVYDLQIAQDEHIYHLKFDENGWLIFNNINGDEIEIPFVQSDDETMVSLGEDEDDLRKIQDYSERSINRAMFIGNGDYCSSRVKFYLF
jgi:hypothetical protein